jgi:hypothetical protein
MTNATSFPRRMHWVIPFMYASFIIHFPCNLCYALRGNLEGPLTSLPGNYPEER